ncbi:MAG: DUF6624 domain-containing protein [Longimicrobiales bacterium]
MFVLSPFPRRFPCVALAALFACARPEPPPEPAGTSSLREELIELGRRDQQGREGLTIDFAKDTAKLREMMRVDSANAARLAEIVRQHGWPGKSEVGPEAAQAAFLIVQHSESLEFRKEMLALIGAAAAKGEADMSDVAMLSDRILNAEGRPQVYGSNFQIRDGRLVPYPITDPARLDERRAAIGLPPMSVYVEQLRQVYKGPVDFDTTKLAPDTTRN